MKYVSSLYFNSYKGLNIVFLVANPIYWNTINRAKMWILCLAVIFNSAAHYWYSYLISLINFPTH